MSTIAVLSDSHDQIPNLVRAVQLANEAKAELLLHCGDLISPFMLNRLARFEGDCHLIYGNNAGDRQLIENRCTSRFPAIHHHGERMELRWKDHRIGMVHYPDDAKELARRGNFDLVCFGHSHEFEATQHGSTILLNPGHLMGENRDGSFCLVHLPQMTVERVCVVGCMFDLHIDVQKQPPIRFDQNLKRPYTNAKPVTNAKQ